MASDLDKKLLEFFRDYGLGVGIPEDDFVEQIKQAFIDAGYVDASKMLQLADLLTQQAGILRDMAQANLPPIYGTGLMTGREWYDCFAKALDDVEMKLVVHNQTPTKEEILMAAKKAAGIE